MGQLFKHIILWNTEKEIILIRNRNVSFTEIVACIRAGQILDRYDHHNKKRYPAQKIFIVEIRNYAYLVPYVENDNEIFLKTIIPSRKATKLYLGKKL